MKQFNVTMCDSADTYVESGKVDGNNLILTRNDKTDVTIDLSAFKPAEADSEKGIKSGELIVDTTDPKQVIRVVNKDDTTVDIDVSGLQDVVVSSGELIGKDTIRLLRSDGNNVDIDITGLGVADIPYITGGGFVTRDNGYWLDFTRSDNTVIAVDMTDIIHTVEHTVYARVMNTGYRINTQADDYTLGGNDFNGRTIVRADKDGEQTITIPKPGSENFIGKSIIVRKTNGALGTLTLLKAGAGVTLSPDDASPLRRVGSTTTLTYIGNGLYDVTGELP